MACLWGNGSEFEAMLNVTHLSSQWRIEALRGLYNVPMLELHQVCEEWQDGVNTFSHSRLEEIDVDHAANEHPNQQRR